MKNTKELVLLESEIWASMHSLLSNFFVKNILFEDIKRPQVDFRGLAEETEIAETIMRNYLQTASFMSFKIFEITVPNLSALEKIES